MSSENPLLLPRAESSHASLTHSLPCGLVSNFPHVIMTRGEGGEARNRVWVVAADATADTRSITDVRAEHVGNVRNYLVMKGMLSCRSFLRQEFCIMLLSVGI